MKKLILILFTVLVSCGPCETQSPNGPEKIQSNTIKILGNGTVLHLYEFEHKEHLFLMRGDFIIHHPACPCNKQSFDTFVLYE